MKFRLLLALLPLMIVACAPKPVKVEPDQGPAAALFQKNCATCHGPGGDGQMVGDKAVPSLKIGKPLTDPDTRLTQQITNGGNGMPPFKYTLTDDEIRQLLRYIRSELQQQKKGS